MNAITPVFVCEELQPLLQNLSTQAEKVLENLPGAQKTAAWALPFFRATAALIMSSSLAYAAITFTAAPLVISAVMFIFMTSIDEITDRIFGSSDAVFLLEELQQLKNLDIYSTNKFENFLGCHQSDTDLIILKALDEDNLKNNFIQLQFFGYSQIALNHLRNTCFETEEVRQEMKTHEFDFLDTQISKLDELQCIHYLGKMSMAATNALACKDEHQEILSGDIISKYYDVMHALRGSLNRKPLESSPKISSKKLNTLSPNGEKIKLAASKCKGTVPMIQNGTSCTSFYKLLLPFIPEK
jgi:hypothetical protein